MPDQVFSDALKDRTTSKRRSIYIQAYFTSYVWSLCHPVQTKSEADDTLSMMFKCAGVLPKIVVKNSKE